MVETVGEKDDDFPLPIIEDELDSATESSGGDVGREVSSFMYKRVTYYWIAFIAQFLKAVLLAIAFMATIKSKEPDKGHLIRSFIISEITGCSVFIFVGILLNFHYVKGSDKGSDAVTAGKHYDSATTCAMAAAAEAFCVWLPLLTSHQQEIPADDVTHTTLIPLIFGLVFISALASMKAAQLTRAAAINVRGTDLICEGESRVEAWRLSTTDESRDLSRQDRIFLPL